MNGPERSPVTRHPPPSSCLKELRAVGLALFLVMTTTSCSGPGYYLQAASGHWQLMRARQDITGIMADPASDPELVKRLQAAREIIGYAGSELGLPASDSYSEYVATGRSAVTWNVVASPEFSLAPKNWCFLVAGCVPYRGYFDEAKARRSADRLAARGLDVAVTPVTAYSTLSWFRDPLLDTMLSRSDLGLAATLIHELAHQRLYVKGVAGFNEAYARFVERNGVESWLRHNGRHADLDRWQALQRASVDFNDLLRAVRDQLESAYASGLADPAMRQAKQGIFEQLRRDYRALVETRWHGRDYFAAWFGPDINNAHLALINSYEGGWCAFEALFLESGRDFHAFHLLAAQRAGLDRRSLEAWLAQDCGAIAPDENL